jgi:hypothetical protein
MDTVSNASISVRTKSELKNKKQSIGFLPRGKDSFIDRGSSINNNHPNYLAGGNSDSDDNENFGAPKEKSYESNDN